MWTVSLLVVLDVPGRVVEAVTGTRSWNRDWNKQLEQRLEQAAGTETGTRSWNRDWNKELEQRLEQAAGTETTYKVCREFRYKFWELICNMTRG